MAASEPEQSILTTQDAWAISEAVISETIQGFFYGLECLLMFAAMYKLFRRGLRNSISRSLLVLVILIMFSCSTATAVCNLVGDVVQIKSLANQSDTTVVIQKTQIIGILCRISYLLGDLIVIWRAWILFDGRRVVRIILAACFSATFVAAVVNLVFSIESVLDFEFKPRPGARLIFPATLFFTNMIATSLVAYKAWTYRQHIKKFLKCGTKRSQVENVLILLVESGFLYSILWILSLVSTSNPQYSDFAVFFGTIIPHAVGIYPTAIILLATSQRTYCDTTLQGVPSLSIPKTEEFSRSLRFASGCPGSGDGSTELGRSFPRDYGSDQDSNRESRMNGLEIVEMGCRSRESDKVEGTEVV